MKHKLRPLTPALRVSIDNAKQRRQCDLCANLQFARCFGPCALADISAQMRAAIQRDREEEVGC